MRYPESVIKAAILHPDIDVREFAVRYFAEGSSQHETLIASVIEAVERYGRDGENGRLLARAVGLPLTPDSIEWMLKELNADVRGSKDVGSASKTHTIERSGKFVRRRQQSGQRNCG